MDAAHWKNLLQKVAKHFREVRGAYEIAASQLARVADMAEKRNALVLSPA